MKTFAALFVCDGGEGSYLIALYVWEITRIMKRNHIRLLDAAESLQLSSIIFSQDVMVYYCAYFPAKRLVLSPDRIHKMFIIPYTGCSLNIVFFPIFFKIFRTLFSLGVSVCTHTRQVENQRCNRTGRVQKNSKILWEKTQ